MIFMEINIILCVVIKMIGKNPIFIIGQLKSFYRSICKIEKLRVNFKNESAMWIYAKYWHRMKKIMILDILFNIILL